MIVVRRAKPHRIGGYETSEFANEQSRRPSRDHSSDRVRRVTLSGTHDIAANLKQTSSRLRSRDRGRQGDEGGPVSSHDGISDNVQGNVNGNLHPQPPYGAEHDHLRDGAGQQYADFVPVHAHPYNVGGAAYQEYNHAHGISDLIGHQSNFEGHWNGVQWQHGGDYNGALPVHNLNGYVNQGNHQHGIPSHDAFPAPPARDYGRLYDWYRLRDEVLWRPPSPDWDGRTDEHGDAHSLVVDFDVRTHDAEMYQLGVHDGPGARVRVVEPVQVGDTEAPECTQNLPHVRDYPIGVTGNSSLFVRKDHRNRKSFVRKREKVGRPTNAKRSRLK